MPQTVYQPQPRPTRETRPRPTPTDFRRSTKIRCDFHEISVRIPAETPDSPRERARLRTPSPTFDRPSVHRVLGFQYQIWQLQYDPNLGARDPIGMKLVPVWNGLFLDIGGQCENTIPYIRFLYRLTGDLIGAPTISALQAYSFRAPTTWRLRLV